LAGPIILIFLPEMLPTGPIVDKAIYGGIIVLTLSFMPGGIVTLGKKIKVKRIKVK